MKTVKQMTKEIDSLIEKRSDMEAMKGLVKIKKIGIRSKFDFCFINFWKEGHDGDSVCEIELNKKESELLRRFLYAMKKRAL